MKLESLLALTLGIGVFFMIAMVAHSNGRIADALEKQNRQICATPHPARTPWPNNDPNDPICGDPSALRK